MFGILQSRPHRLWSLRKGSDLQDRPRYTHTTTLATFPFPEDMEPHVPVEEATAHPNAHPIMAAARRLNELRENWLNPSDLIRREPEIIPGYPERIIPISKEAGQALNKRTLTNLYNERPAWLEHAHRSLDDAVAAAYGWPNDLSDDEVLGRLFALNQERSAAQ
jgi:type II restriction/modification system DNA methylase subunit YeeA